MKVVLCGSRDFSNRYWVAGYIDKCLNDDDVVISGMARGVDSWAATLARQRGLEVIPVPADWSKGRGAGYARNIAMLKMADRVVAFWDQVSRGTEHTIAEGRKMGLDVLIVHEDGTTVRSTVLGEYSASALWEMQPSLLRYP